MSSQSPFSKLFSNDEMLKILAEFERIQGKVYVDNAGTSLYPKCLIEAVTKDLLDNMFQNPHSDKFTADSIDQIRYKVLNFFNTSSQEYSVVFTSGTTAGLKLVAESFQFSNNGTKQANQKHGCFVHLSDNHTSVIGIREYAKKNNAHIISLQHEEFINILNDNPGRSTNPNLNENALMAFSLQSNFNGYKYAIDAVQLIKDGILNSVTQSNIKKSYSHWYTIIDGAAYVSTNRLDLSKCKPDFICLSFYKIFGYPTGLGAVLIKNSSEHVLGKDYFGGGTVEIVLNGEDFHVKRKCLHERFEDGTVSFLSIIALKHCFDSFEKLIPKKINNNACDTVSYHTFYLAKDFYQKMNSLKYEDGTKAVELYCDTNFDDVNTQGGIVAFNLLRRDGRYIGYSEVQHMANLFNICLRTGCHCNTGSCQRHLSLSSKTLKEMHRAGHVCGDDKDLILGRPSGCVRVSFGYYNTYRDVDKLFDMICKCFVKNYTATVTDRSYLKINRSTKSTEVENINGDNYLLDKEDAMLKQCDMLKNTLLEINIYPIKSCGAFKINECWSICERGLKFDRGWMIVKENGVCLTQKQCPAMCLITPIIDLRQGLLILKFPDKIPFKLTLFGDNKSISYDTTFCQSKVCNDNIQGYDCGEDVAQWISEALEISFLRLMKQCPDDRRTIKNNTTKLNLSNQAQFLLINRSTVSWLRRIIVDESFRESIDSLVDRFRGNLIVETGKELEERDWEHVTIGNHLFKVEGVCNRCSMVCIDQRTGEKTIEPLRTIAEVFSGELKFGIYLSYVGNHEKNSTKLCCKSIVKANANISR